MPCKKNDILFAKIRQIYFDAKENGLIFKKKTNFNPFKTNF